MGFFKNKVNVLLAFLLTLVIGAGIFFTLMFFNNQNKILVPDFNNKTKNDVNTWCNSLDSNPCSFTSDYSETIDKDYVIYQSVKADDELDGSISFIISLGKKIIIDAPTINEDTTKDDIIEWANTNDITNITYIEENSDTVSGGYIIRIEPSSNISYDNEVKVYVSIGPKKEETNNGDVITVKEDQYLKLTEQQFIEKVKALGLTPSYVSKKDNYSNTVDKGCILWHGSGDYIKDEEIHYYLSLGKKDDSEIVIKADEFVGKTESEVKEAVTKLGLTPNHGHTTFTDEYSNKYEKGTVIWHGSGTYEKDEKFNYVLSLGKKSNETVYVTKNTYVGKTEEEMKTAIAKLTTNGLTAHHGHTTYTDEYSDTYAKGVVIWHGYGYYDDGEQFNYVLSLGPAVKVDVVSKAGTSEADFKTYLSGLGLRVGTRRTEYSDSVAAGKLISNDTGSYSSGSSVNYKVSLGKDTSVSVPNYAGQDASSFESFLSSKGLTGSKTEQYSDTVVSGKVISNNTGTYHSGDSVNYVVSKGKQPESKYTIMTAGYYGNYKGDSVEATTNNLKNGPFKNFTNVTYTSQVSDKTVGVILSLKVNGSELSSTGEYIASTPIEIVISSGN